MLYELGRVLSFNNAKWGFIDYKEGRLIVFSIKDKKKVAVNPPLLSQPIQTAVL